MWQYLTKHKFKKEWSTFEICGLKQTLNIYGTGNLSVSVKLDLRSNSYRKLAQREEDCPSLIRRPPISLITDVGLLSFFNSF